MHERDIEPLHAANHAPSVNCNVHPRISRNVSFPAKSAAVTQAPKIGKKVQKSKRPRALQSPALATKSAKMSKKESFCNVSFWRCRFPSTFPTPKIPPALPSSAI